MPRWCFPAGKNRFTLSELGTGRVESLPEPFGRLAALYRENRELIESAYPAVRYNVAGYNLRGLVRENRLHLHKLAGRCRRHPGHRHPADVPAAGPTRPLRQPGGGLLRCHRFKAAMAVQAILPMGPAGIEVMDKSAAGPGQRQRSGAAGPHPRRHRQRACWWSSTAERSAWKPKPWAAGSWPCWADRALSGSAYLAVSSSEKERLLGGAQGRRADPLQAQGREEDPGRSSQMPWCPTDRLV